MTSSSEMLLPELPKKNDSSQSGSGTALTQTSSSPGVAHHR